MILKCSVGFFCLTAIIWRKLLWLWFLYLAHTDSIGQTDKTYTLTFSYFHTDWVVSTYNLVYIHNYYSHFKTFSRNQVAVQFLVKLISRKFYKILWGKNLQITTAQCGKTRNSLSAHLKNISSNQLFILVTYLVLVKPLLSRHFCQKCVRENSRNVHTVHCFSVN